MRAHRTITKAFLLRGAALALATTALATTGGSSLAAHGTDEICDGAEVGARSVHAVDRGARKGNAYEVLAEVNLPSRVEDKIKSLADKFHKKTGRSLVVTSGTRDASSQAEVIFEKLEQGDDIVKLYKNKPASIELVHLYQLAKSGHKDRPTTISTLADAIRAQMKGGVFISAHLRAGAADVRSSDMSSSEKRQFVDAVGEVGGLSVMFEATPAHFHMQLQ